MKIIKDHYFVEFDLWRYIFLFKKSTSFAFWLFKVFIILFYLYLHILFKSYSSNSNSAFVTWPWRSFINYFPYVYTFSGTQKPLSGMNYLLQVQKCRVDLSFESIALFTFLLTEFRNLTPLSSRAKLANC